VLYEHRHNTAMYERILTDTVKSHTNYWFNSIVRDVF